MGDVYVEDLSEESVTTISTTNFKDRIAELEKELKFYKDLDLMNKKRIEGLKGEISGLRFAIRANGISGADVH